jgi:hypothetical protein
MPDKIALAASDGYPRNMNTVLAAEYLTQVHGIPVTGKTLQNWRSNRKGPECKFLGSKPFYARQALDEFAEHKAWSNESPHTKVARRRREAGLPTPPGVGRPRTKHRPAPAAE